jgi:hypothetical protein
LPQDLCADDLSNEDGVCVYITAFDNAGLNHREDMIGDQGTSGNAIFVPAFRKLIDIPAGFESEQPDELHGSFFLKNRNAELAACLDEFMSEVIFRNGHGYAGRFRRDLHDGIGDLAVEFLPMV